MKYLLPLLLAVLAAYPTFAEEAKSPTLDEIMQKHAKATVTDIEAYLKANPEAEDLLEALNHLLVAQSNLDDADGQIATLNRKYAILLAEEDLNIGEIINGAIQPQFNLLAENGRKDDARALITKSIDDLKEHPMGARIAQHLTSMAGELDKPMVGDAMDISFTATDGTEVNVSEMKGKVVLVDFWATWCGPCVAEMPNVIAAYNKYHEKGFEVIGISLDQSKDKLDTYVKDNKMPWPQYFDGKGWKNDLAGKFGVRSIPATYLIGTDGKIVASNLRGDALEEKLAELLK